MEKQWRAGHAAARSPERIWVEAGGNAGAEGPVLQGMPAAMLQHLVIHHARRRQDVAHELALKYPQHALQASLHRGTQSGAVSRTDAVTCGNMHLTIMGEYSQTLAVNKGRFLHMLY